MQNPVQNPRLTFGLFEIDLETGELWKAGFRIKLQSQPFKVLACLLERPGQIITREELQLRLWGKDTVVDFDHSLGTAVNKIREALGDSADNPRFVETLSRRGYRFVAPVTRVAPPPQVLPAEEPAATPPAVEKASDAGSAPPEPLAAEPAAPPLRAERNNGILYLLLATATTLTALASGYFIGHQRTSVTPPHIIQITHNGHLAPSGNATENFAAEVTDGPYLYAPTLESGHYGLTAIELAGGNSIPMQIPSDVASPTLGDISPDGSHLLLRDHLSPESEQPLWVVPTIGGSAQRIGSVLAHDATWMPDGITILYASGNDLFTTRSGTSSPEHYATLPGRAFWLRWQPNGKLLRFTVIDPITHTVALYQLNASDRQPKRLLAGFSQPSGECCGVWTADGSQFVFQSSHGGTDNLWQLTGSATTSPIQLTDGPLQFQSPVASRTGHRIYFQGVDARSEFERVSPTGDVTADDSFLAGAVRLDYSRDGQWVVWTDSNGLLWRARADGRERLQLSPDGLDVFLARWSPDGKQLVAMAREPGKAWRIYEIPSSGGSIKPLVDDARNAADPSWSNDGTTIAFGRLNDTLGKENAERGINLLHLDTGKTEPLPNSQGLFSPRWSPDGHYLAALTLDQREVRLYNFATKSWTTITSDSGADPVWSSDSRFLYVHASLDPSQPIERISIPDGKVTVLVRLADSRAHGAVDYVFSGLAPGDVPLIRTRIFTGNLFSLDLKQ
ncbi:MAG: winged helix-turn-helix domain-containing protein [Acidobacteriaceae bacterium]|nr:winged helix-turn-helix domain-containing protein [Acidobacteriaceae bacterium]